MSKDNRAEIRWVLTWAFLIAAVASIPYLIGIAIMPQGYHFVGFTRNIDDCAVYLSWMRQAADGHFFIRNLYTTDPQMGAQFNVFFLMMGNFARVTHLPLNVVFHIFRFVLGVGLLYSIWLFSRLFLDTARQRKFLVPLVGLSAGLGYLFQNTPFGSPVDLWQPEAITFLSIYLNPLFLIGQILMLAALYCLAQAHQTKQMKYGAYGGLALLLLGNIHTYDVITVGAVWGAYVVCLMAINRRIDWRLLSISLLAAGIALPSALYQLYLYKMDPVFHARVETAILSPSIWAYFIGFGLVLVGAVAGAVVLIQHWRRCGQHSGPGTAASSDPRLLLMVWAVIGFVVPYIPVGQQRKLIMGIHIPLCILCVYGLSVFLAKAPRRTANYAMLIFLICSMGSNVNVVAKDIALLQKFQTVTMFSPYISDAQLQSMLYLKQNAKAADVIYAPWMPALLIPAYAGKQVYYGHWSETPDYAAKLSAWYHFAKDSTPEMRKDTIESIGATYIVQDDTIPLAKQSRSMTADYLKAVWQETSATGKYLIYKVERSRFE